MVTPFPHIDLPSEKILLQLDDTRDVLEAFRPFLQNLLGSHAHFLQHTTQTRKGLVDAIIRLKPDIMLLDGNLAGGIRGYELLPLIQERLPHALCIGFSSASGLRESFMKAGAQGFVVKDASEPEETLRELAEVLEDLP